MRDILPAIIYFVELGDLERKLGMCGTNKIKSHYRRTLIETLSLKCTGASLCQGYHDTQLIGLNCDTKRGVRKLTGENLKVVLGELSTLS
jgi:hypothetical protein